MTAFPVKQGGLAAQQADAAARDIAARAGIPVTPAPFRPLLRAALLTGEAPKYFEATLTDLPATGALVDERPLWWPAGKIAGGHIASYLAERVAGVDLAAAT
jgi:sulfide:quinone oxidoreductase